MKCGCEAVLLNSHFFFALSLTYVFEAMYCDEYEGSVNICSRALCSRADSALPFDLHFIRYLKSDMYELFLINATFNIIPIEARAQSVIKVHERRRDKLLRALETTDVSSHSVFCVSSQMRGVLILGCQVTSDQSFSDSISLH